MSMSYREMYDHVFGPETKAVSRLDKIKTLAQFLFAERKQDAAYSKEDAAWEALELYEDMCGLYFDPTHAQFESICNSII